MRYMLDTNICIYLMKNDLPAVRAKFATLGFGDVLLSAITLAELRCGAAERHEDQSRVFANIERLLTFVPVAPFDNPAAASYAALWQAVPERKRDALDRLIAAHAYSQGLTLVTNNETDFTIYPGLLVENWVATPPQNA